MENKKKLSVLAFVLMILTAVFGVTNIGIGYYQMGYAAIPMFIIGGILFFIPYILMMIEFGTGFRNQEGGIYTWMEKSVNRKYAFIGIMMWYSSYAIWIFTKSLSMWVPLSFMIFGKDITVVPVNFGTSINFGPFLLGIIGIILVLITTKLVTYGPTKFAKFTALGGISIVVLNIILMLGGILVFMINGFELSEPLTLSSFVTSPNADYQSVVPFLGFLVFAVFAFGGMEAMAGISDELENPKKNLKKSIFIAGGFIVICYVVGFLMIGAIMKHSSFGTEDVSSLSALFIIMENLGNSFDNVLGTSFLGTLFTKLSGLGMFLSYLGAFIALSYAPLKQLISGTPKKFWPESYQIENKNGVRVAALKMQAIIVIGFISVKSIVSLISPDGAAALYELTIKMTSVGMTIPYLFLIFAWYRYKKNDKLEKDIEFFKNKKLVTIIFYVTFITVLFGNVFAIITPFVEGDINSGIWTVIGPILFSLIAIVIYNKAEKR